MAKSFKFELDMKGLREILKSDSMQQIISQNVNSIAETASGMAGGAEYGSDTRVGDYDTIGTVFPASIEATVDNYENNTLLKALGMSGLPNHK